MRTLRARWRGGTIRGRTHSRARGAGLQAAARFAREIEYRGRGLPLRDGHGAAVMRRVSFAPARGEGGRHRGHERGGQDGRYELSRGSTTSATDPLPSTGCGHPPGPITRHARPDRPVTRRPPLNDTVPRQHRLRGRTWTDPISRRRAAFVNDFSDLPRLVRHESREGKPAIRRPAPSARHRPRTHQGTAILILARRRSGRDAERRGSSRASRT